LLVIFLKSNVNQDVEIMEDAELVALQSDLRNDIMTGVRKIARFIGESERRTYYLLEKGVIPAGKLGGQGPWIGSKRQIAAALQKVASGRAASDVAN
jgi:hypothetical protein